MFYNPTMGKVFDNSKPLQGMHILSQKLTSSDPRLNPSSKTSCAKCSERNNLSYAYAYGKPMFLCPEHYKVWFAEAQRDKEMVRQQPFKQVTTIDGKDQGVEKFYGKQDRRIF